MPLGPFDWTGGPFLELYGVLLVFAVIAGLFIPHWLRPEGGSACITDPDELAYLAGGKSRLADAIIARLLAAGQLAMPDKHRFAIVRPGPIDPGLATLTGDQSYAAITRAVLPQVAAVKQRLTECGMLMERGTAAQLRGWSIAPYFLLLGFGALKWDIGVARERPVGFLTILLVLTAAFALIRALALDPRTRAGIAAVKDARQQHERLGRAARPEETGLAVALFGTGVLATTAYADFHRLRSSDSGVSSGGDTSGDGGGGDGGGGGCGGCGS